MSALRPITPAEREAVLAINARNVPMVGPLDAARFDWLLSMARHASVICAGDAIAGWVLTLAPGTAYDSPNYRFFADRYDDFLYLDRIAIDQAFRRRGLGSRVYDELEAAAGARMVLEVNDDNEGSLAFHRARGYVEVARERHVVLMEKQTA